MGPIVIVGRLPKDAGIGGVTVHVDRLSKWLARTGISVQICDYKLMPIYAQIKLLRYSLIVHIHASHPIFRFLYVIISRILRKKSILTIHGNIGRFGFIKNSLDKLSIKLCDIPIVINEGSYIQAIKWNKKTRLVSAYLPPLSEGYLPDFVRQRIERARDEDKKIICTNASARSFTPDGNEIYGIDFLISYFKGNPSYYLCVSDPSSQYSDFYNNRSYDNILFITEPHSFYALMKCADVSIRATATDGDSLSVREGLDIGITVIATDCVSRPEGTILFKYNDAQTLTKALTTSASVRSVSNNNVIEELVEIYNS